MAQHKRSKSQGFFIRTLLKKKKRTSKHIPDCLLNLQACMINNLFVQAALSISDNVQIIYLLILRRFMKYQVNCQIADSKAKAYIYKELVLSSEETLEQRLDEILQKPNIRIFCYQCQLDITRHAHAILKSYYLCIKCFANLDEQNEPYIIRSSMRKSFTKTSWDLLDEVILITAFKLWGFGNWSQIKQYLDYNGSPFTHQQIQRHFQEFYLQKDNNLPDFEKLYQLQPKQSFTQKALKLYEKLPRYKQLSKKDSKGQKRIVNCVKQNESFLIQASADEQDKQNVVQCKEKIKQPQHESNRSLLIDNKLKGNVGSILGYNNKRRQFQLGQYDYTAETVISDLQFYDDDSPQEYGLKIQLIKQYNRRLQERLKRRQFVVQYKLLDSNYTYGNQNKIDKEANITFQPFMRYTDSYSQYKNLVNNFSLIKRYERLVNNLSKLRQKVSKIGTIEDSYDFIKKKRKKYIKNWQKASNKSYPDKRRCIYKVIKDEQAGQYKIQGKNQEQINQELNTHLKDMTQFIFQRQKKAIKNSDFQFTELVPNNKEVAKNEFL